MAETPGGQILVYEAPDGEVRVDVRLEKETVWLSLNQMADLFGRDKSVISRHLHGIFRSGELERTATVAKSATVQREGEREVGTLFGREHGDALAGILGPAPAPHRGSTADVGALSRARSFEAALPQSL